MAEKQPNTAIAVQSKVAEIAARCREAAVARLDDFPLFVGFAEGLAAMREAIQPHVPKLLTLAGSPLGFRCDKEYGREVLTEVMVEALIRGVRPIGNEFNVIGGRCYVTKEGYTRLVRELPGLTDLVLIPGVPAVRDGGAVVRYRAQWKLDGALRQLDREIAVRLHPGQGADAAVGKATRKMLAAVHATVTGSVWSECQIDAEDLDAGGKATKSDQLADRLAGAKGDGEPAAAGK